jgi:hypothetical protein
VVWSLHQHLPPLSILMPHPPQVLKMVLARMDGSYVVKAMEEDVALRITFVALAVLLKSAVLQTRQSSNQAVLRR